MIPFNTNTQDLSYDPQKHPHLLSLTPTGLHNLHFDMNMCYPQIDFSIELFVANE